ncbi:MAG: isoprenyl transferase [Clostridia bacterium]|nr:isoprenyl transferase [Clostridia bacterium]
MNDSKNSITLPDHIAIIMDGNGRWAKKRGLPRSAGHRQGANAIQNLAIECDKLGLKYLTVYAFSTENWTRPQKEIDSLMSLIREFLEDTEKKFEKQNIRIRTIGRLDRLESDIVEGIKRTVKNNAQKTGLTFTMAIDYGSRDEIIHAVKQIIKNGIKEEDINEELFNSYLYTHDLPYPDLIIRPSGEQRLSNFLLWQASYSELWYSNILWPDFRIKHMIEAIKVYNKRERRFGGIK